MKKVLFITLLLILALLLQNAQSGSQPSATATMKSSSRLFSMKDDLTSVILIIPVDSTVAVLDSDSTYFHVVFQDNEGYIFKKHAVLDKAPVTKKTVQQQTQPVTAAGSGAEQFFISRKQIWNQYGSKAYVRKDMERNEFRNG